VALRLKIWGCRGSIATPSAGTTRYGGNTSCVEVLLDDETALVLDAGTGIRELGLDLVRRGTRNVHVLLTHLHLDHLEGLRFFAPLWDGRTTIQIWGPRSPVMSLHDRILRVPAAVTFHDLPAARWSVEGISVAADLVLHPGPTLGFRLESEGSTLAYIPDHEPALAGIADVPLDWLSGAVLAHDVDLLIHDAQYREDEYAGRLGWGHSSVPDAVAYARAVGARRLVLFHHEPEHADEALEELADQARELAGADQQAPVLAREGETLEV
jgi:phosphoribosyl 1,2-cyclic phosphodiesterase